MTNEQNDEYLRMGFVPAGDQRMTGNTAKDIVLLLGYAYGLRGGWARTSLRWIFSTPIVVAGLAMFLPCWLAALAFFKIGDFLAWVYNG